MAKLSPKMWYLLKYGFLAIIVAGIIVSVLPESDPADTPDLLQPLAENYTEPYIEESYSPEIFKDDVTECIKKAIRATGADSETETIFDDEDHLNNKPKDIGYDQNAFTILTSFNNILSLLDVRAVIIEPSVLYCMLRPKYQEFLLKRHFNLSEFSKSSNIFTYAIMESDVATLQKEDNIYKFTEMDFQPFFVQQFLPDWKRMNATLLLLKTFPSHIFYKHKSCTIHIVVFHERNNYYWQAALNAENNEDIPLKEKLLFVEHNSAFERFAFVSLEDKVLPIAEFYVPSNTHYFLFEMMSSRFLECDSSRSVNVNFGKLPKSHPRMSVASFNRRTLIVLRELKAIFRSLFLNLWIWSGTMLGWYRQCDIIPYTSDVDFGAWASEVEDLDAIINLLLVNKHVIVKEKMGLLEEALEFHLDCHNLRTDVFFVYQIKNGTWYSGHSPKLGYYFRYFLTNFSLCSAELLGEKVQVPCETERVIANEYGPGWNKPASMWNYESSSKSRGPNIYWNDKMLKNAYQVY